MYHRILQVVDNGFRGSNALRVLLTSGAPLPFSTLQGIVEKLTPNFYNYYATVDGGGISLLKPDNILVKSDSVGQGAFNTEIKIVNEMKQEVPCGVIGEVMYRSPGTAQEYYKNPRASKESFADGWFLPGDLTKMDEDGFLYIVGRKKDMIIRGGVNIYPPEIEEILHAHPAVYEAAVAGVPDEEYGEEIGVFIVLKPGMGLDRDKIIRYCKERLASYKRPKHVTFLSSLPKASSGKVIKRELIERYMPNK
jgi:acyl-CoA synthetase (AMP-forming)/AMP-acid ligase II